MPFFQLPFYEHIALQVSPMALLISRLIPGPYLDHKKITNELIFKIRVNIKLLGFVTSNKNTFFLMC